MTMTQTGDEDFSDRIARLDALLKTWGLRQNSKILAAVGIALKLPDGIYRYSPKDFDRLSDFLEARWLKQSHEQQLLRFKIRDRLKSLKMSWDHPGIETWLKRQNTPFASLSEEQLQALLNKLDELPKKLEQLQRVPVTPALD